MILYIKPFFIRFNLPFFLSFNHQILRISWTNSIKVKKSHLSGLRISCTPANFDQVLRSPESQTYPESTVLIFDNGLGFVQ